MRFTFTKADRIRSSGEYRTLSRKGRRYVNDFFVVVYREQPFSSTRLGITVSKKVGKAVTRNRVKRIIREFFRLNRNLLPGQLDINLIARQPCGQAGSVAIWKRIHNCFKGISAQPVDIDDRQTGATAD